MGKPSENKLFIINEERKCTGYFLNLAPWKVSKTHVECWCISNVRVRCYVEGANIKKRAHLSPLISKWISWHFSWCSSGKWTELHVAVIWWTVWESVACEKSPGASSVSENEAHFFWDYTSTNYLESGHLSGERFFLLRSTYFTVQLFGIGLSVIAWKMICDVAEK